MIEGIVNEALEPIVEIGLKQGEAVTTILVVVDTGFTGPFYWGTRQMTEWFAGRHKALISAIRANRRGSDALHCARLW